MSVITKEDFLEVAKTLYYSDEYNKAISELAYTRNQSAYVHNLLTVFTIQQKIIDEYKRHEE